MNWAWLLLVVLLSWTANWPWLIAVVGLSWIGHWPSSAQVLVWELILVLAFEGGLAFLTTRWRAREVATVAMEGVAVGPFALLWGAVLGLVLWQAALGFDALSRMKRLKVELKHVILIRGLRAAAGLLFVLLYSHGF